MKNKLLLSLFTLLLAACSDIKFAAVNVPASLSFGGTISKDIAYGDLSRQSLDIYQPDAQGPHPVIVFFHGGRWTFGNKDQYKFAAVRLSEMGYVVAVPNTRLYPAVKHPAFVEDAAMTVAWVYANISEYGGKANNLFLAGHSSGAHIASLVSADASYLRAYDLEPSIINAFAGLSGPYDFEPEAEDLKDMFGPPANYPSMQISTFIDGDEPPMLLIYGDRDETVHIRNLELARDAIEDAGGTVVTKIYDNANHIDTVAALSWANPANIDVAETMDMFFKRYMGSD